MTTRLSSSERTRRRFSGWWVPALAAVGLQLWGVYRPTPPPVEPDIPAFDKIAHLLVFALPTLLISTALDRTLRARRVGTTVLPVAVIFAGHAVISELVQGAFYARRTGDPLDVLADLIGVAIGAVIALLVLRKPR